MARKPLLANDPLSGGETGSVMEGILERNRERSGRAKPTTAEPPVLPVEPTRQETELYTIPQSDNLTITHVSLSDCMDVHNPPKAQKPATNDRSSGKTKKAVSEGVVEISNFTSPLTVRERVQELAASIKIPPKTLSARITEEVEDRLNELAYRFKKEGSNKQSLVIALLERGLAELDKEEGR